jgi:hypothetical protein
LEERDRILKMVRDHRISAEEGARLLDLVSVQDERHDEPQTIRVGLGSVVTCDLEWCRTLAQTVARSITEEVESVMRCGVRPALDFVFGGSRSRT